MGDGVLAHFPAQKNFAPGVDRGEVKQAAFDVLELDFAAREFAVQFLYQCESEKIFHFSDSHFQGFVGHQDVHPELIAPLRELARGTLDRTSELDEKIQAASANWNR